jgi:hypothetical protein
MKKIMLSACLLALMQFSQSQTLKTPTPSPTQEVKQDFGLSAIELSYSRPTMKGRAIFGSLVPYGKVWRTGANSATVISFGDDVWFGDTKVPAGKYGLLTIPGESEWTVLLTKALDVTSPAAYKSELDVVRVKVKPQPLPFSLESFTIMFNDVKSSTLNLDLMWDKTLVTVPIKTEVDSKVMAQIDDVMKTDNRPYYQAGLYYMNNNKDLNKALEWLNKASEIEPDAYWVWYQKANCLAKLGKKSEAMTASNKSKQLATAQKNEDYVALNENLQKTLK